MHRGPFQKHLSIRIHSEFGHKIGSKQIAFLEAIQSQGSITRAAKFFGLSYRAAHLLIAGINEALHQPVISTVIGGRNGGGAALSLAGKQLVENYRAIEVRAQAVATREREMLDTLARPKKASESESGSQ